MRTRILISAFILAVIATAGAEKLENFSGGQNISCWECRKLTTETRRGYSSCSGCVAWRRYDLEIPHYVYKWNPDRKEYTQVLVEGTKNKAVYRCPHGHTLEVDF